MRFDLVKNEGLSSLAQKACNVMSQAEYHWIGGTKIIMQFT